MVLYAENEIGFIYKNGAYETKKVSELSKVDAETIEYIYMGGYPTKRVTDEETIAKLNKTSFKSEGTAMLNGVRYNKVNYQEADGSIKVLYYINEALKWKVLNIEDGVLTLITDRIIDFEPIKKEASSVTWSDSKLKGWLETNFRNTTFTDREKKLLEGNPDMLKESELSLNGVSLRSSCTDYARMGYNFGNAFYDAYAAAEWWLKPESDENLSEYRYVASDGSISDSKVEETERKGVRPVSKIRMSVS